ncbi:hypothetical protein [Corynebacterium sp. TAE3-ERU2]|uniref:hypothetical protein n=1 Tax=Corynebacterium sp. TAE3-ERU2 TaxID=2849497 RepID=UPI001C442515|nr:hypothetical protein [Corynebacterium sp. TAE3-ERU2]MBV7302044.1 hypothetical protein [Corynebacterium sp. TAE3-ERU2]
MLRKGPLISGSFFALACALITISAAITVKEELDTASKVHNGGLPYSVCFLLAGLSVTALIVYSLYLSITGWSTTRFLRAMCMTVRFSAVLAVVCSVWFIVVTDLFNMGGVLGIMLALSCMFWANGLFKLHTQEHS